MVRMEAHNVEIRTNICDLSGGHSFLFSLCTFYTFLFGNLTLECLSKDVGTDLQIGHVFLFVKHIEGLKIYNLKDRASLDVVNYRIVGRTSGLNPICTEYLISIKDAIMQQSAFTTDSSGVLYRAFRIYEETLDVTICRLKLVIFFIIRVLEDVLSKGKQSLSHNNCS